MQKSATTLRIFLFLLIIGTLPGLALAQIPIPGTVVGMTAECGNGDVTLSIHFSNSEEPPANIVGWRVKSEVLGSCESQTYVCDLQPWPALGESEHTLTVTPRYANRDEVFRIWAIDDAGQRVYISWGDRRDYAHADCMDGPSTIGYIVNHGQITAFEPCPDNCWWGLSFFDTYLPPDLVALADSGQLVDIHGQLNSGMEGDYIEYDDFSWNLSNESCGTVANEERSWDALKSLYR